MIFFILFILENCTFGFANYKVLSLVPGFGSGIGRVLPKPGSVLEIFSEK